jgi:cellulose synthase/poly-beta-1,6-N-acetylglucosamine synthase-like glycosyltransferase
VLPRTDCLSIPFGRGVFSKVIIDSLHLVVLGGCLLAAVPVAVFVLETIAAIALPKGTFPPLASSEPRGRLGVLIPAHNEEEMLRDTIANIQPRLRHADRMVVVADNCSDDTAAVATSLGAEVVVRTDPLNIGKGFALDCGVRHFAKDSPAIVIVVDADCKLEEFAIDRLAATCNLTNRPVQARYTMLGAPNTTPGARVREFAWRVKTWIRPLGLYCAGGPCQLMGTGMAFPWEIIAEARLATGALVEDLMLGLELASDGHPPIFCPTATVTSEFPHTGEGSRSQQLRWERGHLSVIAAAIPGLFVKALRRRDVSLFALTLDAAVPPLSFLWIIILLLLGLSFVFWRMGASSVALWVAAGDFAGFTGAAAACWIKWGRDLLPLTSVLLLAARPLTKLPFYFQILFKKNRQIWIRTDRRKS